MSNRLFVASQPVIKSKSSQKNKIKKVAVEKSLNTNALEKVKELEAKLAHLSRLLKDGKKHAGLELQTAITKKRLAKAKEMYKISALINVKSMHPDNHRCNDVATASTNKKSTTISNKTTSKEYGNYYSMRAKILHMEIHKQSIIETKGLQEFLTEYQNKLAKCFQFEQNQTVPDLFATNRINKLTENSKELRATDSETSMIEVTMEKDLDTLVSINRSCSSQFNDHTDGPNETNFLGQFLKDKVLEFLQAAAAPNLGDFQSRTFPCNMRNVTESVSDSRLDQLMTVRPKINRSAASVNEDFHHMKLRKFRGKSSDITDIIPIKNARAMTDIKKTIQ